MKKYSENYPSIVGLRETISILVGVAWLVFGILWLAFFAAEYTLYENIGVLLASVILCGLINVILWNSGHSWRTIGSNLLGLGYLLFLAIWFALFAFQYNLYQNAAIVLASMLLYGTFTSKLWNSYIRKSQPCC